MAATVHIIPGAHALRVAETIERRGYSVTVTGGAQGRMWLTGRPIGGRDETAHGNENIARFPRRRRQYGHSAHPGGDGPKGVA